MDKAALKQRLDAIKSIIAEIEADIAGVPVAFPLREISNPSSPPNRGHSFIS